MTEHNDIQAIQAKVNELERTARDIIALSREVPALECNTRRILASCAMLRITLGEAAPFPGIEGEG